MNIILVRGVEQVAHYLVYRIFNVIMDFFLVRQYQLCQMYFTDQFSCS